MIILGHCSLIHSTYPLFGKNKNNFAITPQSPRKYCYFGAFKIFRIPAYTGETYFKVNKKPFRKKGMLGPAKRVKRN